jgi:hypothetical protein
VYLDTRKEEVRMKVKIVSCALVVACALAVAGCADQSGEQGNAGSPGAGDSAANQPKEAQPNQPLPEGAYKAGLTLPEPPTKFRAGQKQTVKVRVKNLSDIKWRVRGEGESNQFYVAVGNSWLDKDEKLLTNMDGRFGLQENLEPGAETEVPLQVTAPKEPGDYVLELDVVQEGVTWFKDKGSQTLKVKMKVE